jgi:stage IV sporulation protein B
MKALRLITGILTAATLLLFTAETLSIPQNIYMSTGSEHTLRALCPLTATIENDSVQALNINNKPISDKCNVNLMQGFSLNSADSGVLRLKLGLMGVPLKVVRIQLKKPELVTASGKAVGICVDSEGVLVLGTGSVDTADGAKSPSDTILRSGDIITEVNSRPITTKEELTIAVDEVASSASIDIIRNNQPMSVSVTPAKSSDGHKRLGLWVRDGTQGIGTITYFRKDGRFGALGHPITDVDTGKLMSISGGNVLEAEIAAVDTGRSGHPGALIGELDFDKPLGTVTDNNELGLYGTLSPEGKQYVGGIAVELGNASDIHRGSAYILTEVDKNTGVKPYSIEIESVNRYSLTRSKAMTIRITDSRLTEKTGGIVQGMSGSPIIQDNKLIGAVTHVLVSNPKKGYACLCEDMLELQDKLD